MMKIRGNISGFTLIELMIVIAIIGVLASIAVPNFRHARDKARQTKCFEFSTLLTRTTEIYNLERRVAPGDVKDLGPFLGKGKLPICPTKGEYQWVSGTGVQDGKKVQCTIHGCASATWGG